MSGYLTGGKMNINLLQENASKDLIFLLDKCDGPKVHEKINICYINVLIH